MRPLRIIVTACGCPGASTLIRMLKNNGERDVEIVGVDMDEQAIGRFLADRFYVVPAADSQDYIPRMLELIEREQPDVVFPESSSEVYPLSVHRQALEQHGSRIVVSDPEAISLSNNKWEMYETLRRETDLVLPRYCWPGSLDEFLRKIEELGYPEKPVCFKPHVGKGSRGFRIIDPRVSRRDLLLEYKPNSRYMSREEFIQIFASEDSFPDFLLMEYLEGTEYTTDCLAYQGEALLTTVKTVEQARWGVVVKSELVHLPEPIEQTRVIVRTVGLDYNVNLQFIGDRLIEINPRVSSFIYQNDLIPPYLAVKLALGEMKPADIARLADRIQWGRRMVRYMDQVFWNPSESPENDGR